MNQIPFGFTWMCPTCLEVSLCDLVGKKRYQCGNCGDWHQAEDIKNYEFCYEEEPEEPEREYDPVEWGDDSQQESERAEAEERGIPDYDDMGFLLGYTLPDDPADL